MITLTRISRIEILSSARCFRNFRGADIEAKNNWDETILYAATANNSLEVATLLIDRGVDIEQDNDVGGWSSLHIAARNNSLDFARLLIDRGANIEGIDLSWMN